MCDKRAAGFTLLEVVVALAIAAMALIVLFRSGSDGLVAVATASRAEEAVQRAQSHLAALGRAGPLVEGQSQGDDGGGYRWQLRVAPMSRWVMPGSFGSGVAVATLYDVEVRVSWRGNGRDRAVVLTTERVGTAVTHK
jgi:general secretion pathway protein I